MSKFDNVIRSDQTHEVVIKMAFLVLHSVWRLVFLAYIFLGFLIFLPKMLAIIPDKVRKILQDFSRSLKEIQENFWSFWQENQKYPRSWQDKQENLASK